jgi:hypothetical protein
MALVHDGPFPLIEVGTYPPELLHAWFRNSFLFVVQGRWASEAERSARQQVLSAGSAGGSKVIDKENSEARGAAVIE